MRITRVLRSLARTVSPAVLLVTTLLVSIAVAQTAPAAATAAILTIAAFGVTAALAARYVAVAIRTRRLQVGTRDRRHSESLDRMASPAHPATAGRPLPRAPGLIALTA